MLAGTFVDFPARRERARGEGRALSRKNICGDSSMAEATAAEKVEAVKQAAALVDALLPVKHLLAGREAEFVLAMDEKLKRYGYGAFVSEKQMKWLRLLEKQYSPDPRQMSLL
jgi:hypothetical protein